MSRINTGAAKKPVKRRMSAKVDTTEHDIGQDAPRDLPSVGEASLGAQMIETVDGPISNSFLDELAFMEEKIEVMVHESTDKNAQPVVEAWCNGRSQFFLRGVPVAVKRKFVGVLARAKETSYTQQEITANDGSRTIRNIPHTALKTPFSVMADPNPRGADWLRKTLAEA